MTVRSSEITDSPPRADTPPRTTAGPIPRAYLRAAKKPARIIAGSAFIAYSAVATIRYVNSDFAPVLGNTQWGPMPAGIVLGFIIALVIILWEWLASEEHIFWYLLPLTIDSWYTYRMTFPWVTSLATVHLPDSTTAWAVSIFVSFVGAVCVALFGERLLFGRRR